ncbi:hypothetical protein I656_00665 [Geobacillus sp. WSUCF1]|nr:hypothetical protein I656_00665 [Geobacillus sp. WSUCF1]
MHRYGNKNVYISYEKAMMGTSSGCLPGAESWRTVRASPQAGVNYLPEQRWRTVLAPSSHPPAGAVTQMSEKAPCFLSRVVPRRTLAPS